MSDKEIKFFLYIYIYILAIYLPHIQPINNALTRD